MLTPAGGRKQPTPPSVERAMALRDVMDHAVRIERENATRSPGRRSRTARRAALIVSVALLGCSAYSLIVRPAFIWGEPFVESRSRADASTRLGMYLLAQRLEAFRTEAGHYPASLGDIGEAVEGVQYALVSDSLFELRSTVDSAVVLRSNTPIDAFLGNSVSVIQGPSR